MTVAIFSTTLSTLAEVASAASNRRWRVEAKLTCRGALIHVEMRDGSDCAVHELTWAALATLRRESMEAAVRETIARLTA